MEESNYWTKWARRRLSRRRLLVGAATVGAGAAGRTMGGWGGGGEEAPAGATATPAAAGQPRRGGRYKWAIPGDWGTIDPLTSVAYAPGDLFPFVYNVLADQSRTKPEFFYFDLAESLEQPDDVTYIYAIRSGVKIAPNDLGIPERDLDAVDAQRWLERVSQDERAVHRPFTNQYLASFEAPDAGTFTIKTKGPYAYFLLRLGSRLGGTMPPREFFEQGISVEDKGVGAGPFVIRPGTYVETGGISLDRNPNYYRRDEATGEQPPYIDGRDAVRISARQPRRTAFVDRQIYQYGAETRAEVDQLLGQLPDLVVVENPEDTFIAFSMNPTRDPWKDERIRKAALYALNREEFVNQIVGEGAGRPNGLVHWPLGSFALDPEELEKLQPYDPKRSRDLIRAATGQDTIGIKVMYPANSDIQFHKDHLPIFLKQMRDAGFDIQEDPQEFGNWLASYTNVDYDASLSLNQQYETAEIPIDWHSAKGPQGNGLYATGIGALFPALEKAIGDSKRTTDPEELVQKVKDVQRLIYEKGPAFLPIFSWLIYDVYHGFVKNHPNTRGLGDTHSYLNDWWLEL